MTSIFPQTHVPSVGKSQGVSAQPANDAFSLPKDARSNDYPKTPNGVTGLSLSFSTQSHFNFNEFSALFFSHQNMNGQTGTAVFNQLQNNQTIKHLILSDNPIFSGSSASTFAMAALADLLKVNHFIGWLVLNKTAVGNFGVTQLADSLKENTGVIHLILADNEIGDEGVAALSEMLKQNITIKSLFLQGNTHIGNDGIEALINGLSQNSTLTRLDLRDIGPIHISLQNKLKDCCRKNNIRLSL